MVIIQIYVEVIIQGYVVVIIEEYVWGLNAGICSGYHGRDM